MCVCMYIPDGMAEWVKHLSAMLDGRLGNLNITDSSLDPVGLSPVPAGSSPDPAGSSPVPAGSSPDPAGSSPDPVGSSLDPAGSIPDPAGSNLDPAGSNPARVKSMTLKLILVTS